MMNHIATAERELPDCLPEVRIRHLSPEEDGAGAVKLLAPKDLSPDQRLVYDQALAWVKSRRPSVLAIGGYAGTGKTTLVATIAHELCIKRRKAVAFLTPTAKAASVLRRKLAPLQLPTTYVGTVHSFMYSPVLDQYEGLAGWKRRYFTRTENDDGSYSYECKDSEDMPRVDLIIVDEASMVSEEMELDILQFKVPVLAVGDHGQLPPVQGTSSWMTKPDLRLEKIHRQAEDNPILALATYVREEGGLPRNVSDFGIPFYRGLYALGDPLEDAYDRRGHHEVALICYTNRLRARLNMEVHRSLHDGHAEPGKGSQVICLKNNSPLVNGMRGVLVSHVEKRDIWYVGDVHFPDENYIYSGPFLQRQFGEAKAPKDTNAASELVGRPIDRMKDLGALFDFGYAMTCHKAQGSQFEEVVVVLEHGRRPQDYARWLYTAITRASEKLSFCET